MGAPSLTIYTLGTFAVYRGEHRIRPEEWRTERNETLLKILITAPGMTFPVDTLIEYMWAEAGSETHLANLRGRVSEVRRILEPDLERGNDSTFIKTVPGGYQLNAAACFIDKERLRALYEQGMAAKDDDPNQAVSHLKEAASYYNGPFLPANLHDEWTLQPRRDVESLYRQLLGHLLELLLTQEAYDDAIYYADQLLSQHPTREDAYRILMRCYDALNDPATALRIYEQCHQTLKAQDLVPSEETSELANRIRTSHTPQNTRHRIEADVQTIEKQLESYQTPEQTIDSILALSSRLKALSERTKRGERLQQALDLASAVDDPHRLARVWQALAELYYAQGHPEQSIDSANEAIRHFEKANDVAGIAATQALCGKTYLDAGNYEAAQKALDEGRKRIHFQTGAEAKQARLDLYTYYAQLGRRRQQYAQALTHLDQALLLAESLGDHERMARLLLSIGALYYHWEKPAQAKLAWEQGYYKAHRLGLGSTKARALNNLGLYYTVAGPLDTALTCFRDAIQAHEQATDIRGLADAWDGIANVYNLLGYEERAREAYQRSLDYSSQSDDVIGMAMARTNLGNILNELGDPDAAKEHLEQALSIFRKEGDQWWEVQARTRLARAHKLQGDNPTALALLDEALTIANAIDSAKLSVHVLSLFAKIHREDSSEEAFRFAEKLANEVWMVSSQPIAINAHYELYQAYVESDKKTALSHLRMAHGLVMEQAECIGNQELKQSYLSVPLYRAIQDEWHQQFDV